MNLDYLKEVTGYDLEEVVVKKNGVEKKGFTFVKDPTVRPVLYPPNNLTENELAEWLKNAIKEFNEENDYNDVKSFIDNMKRADVIAGLRIGFYQKGNEGLICKSVPQMPGIIQYLYFLLPSSNDADRSQRRITDVRNLLKKYDISEEEAWIVAKNNLAKESVIKNLADFLGMYGPAPHIPPFYIVSVKDGCNGAAAILCSKVLHELKEKIGNELLVLPSSVHEVLVGPRIYGSIDDMSHMVQVANMEVVSPEERLSDRAYYISVA